MPLPNDRGKNDRAAMLNHIAHSTHGHAIKFDVCRLHGWQPFVGTAAEAAITTSHQSRCFLQAGSLLTRTTAAEAAAAAAEAAAEAAPGAASADTRRALHGALAAAWALEQCCFVTESCDVHSDT